MKRITARVHSAVFIAAQAHHELIHLMLGTLWFFVLHSFFPELSSYHFFIALFGSVLPDAEHVAYFYLNGKRDGYSRVVRQHIKKGQWKELTLFLKGNHKQLTTLKFHSFQWVLLLIVLAFMSYFFDHMSTLILLGAMVIHYAFDIIDDLIFLGKINPNWKKTILPKPKFL